MDKVLKPGVIDKHKNIYRWMHWIIKGKHPFSFCENTYSRKVTAAEEDEAEVDDAQLGYDENKTSTGAGPRKS